MYNGYLINLMTASYSTLVLLASTLGFQARKYYDNDKEHEWSVMPKIQEQRTPTLSL